MDSPGGFLRERLNSGVEVIGQPMSGVESVAVGVLAGTGARDEAPGEAGISHFTEQMLFRGTEHLDARRLSERFDILGIDYDSSAGIEMTLVSAVLLGTKLDEALELLADVVRAPSFPAEEMESVRALILQEVRQREDKPPAKLIDLLRRRFFDGSPLGNDVLGTEESITHLSRQDLVGYWEDRFTANNLTISIAGNFDWQPVLEHLSRLTASWPAGRGRTLVESPSIHSHMDVIKRDLAQQHIGLALPGVPVDDPDYYAASLLAQVFAGVSNSRLRLEVREKRGLAYAAHGRFDAMEKTGLFRIYIGTSAERAHESVEVAMEELQKLVAHGVTDDELRLAKTRLESQLIMRSESTAARMAANLRSWWFEHRLYSLDEVRARIESVTTDQIGELLQRLQLTRTITALAIGPRGEEEIFGGLLVPSG